MAAGTLTTEAVLDGIKAVLERGEYPSMAKVRHELETTASQQTLSNYMKDGLRGIAKQMGTGLPEGLPRSVVEAAHRFYTEARDSAREELEKQRAFMREREAALTEDAEHARQDASALTQQVAQLQQRAETADAEAVSLGQQLADSHAARADSQDKCAKLTAALARTRTQAAQQLRQLRAEHRRCADALIRERDQMAAMRDREIKRADSQQLAWAQQIDAARQSARAAETEITKQAKALGEERDRAIAQRNKEAQSVRDKQRQIHGLAAELDASQQRVATTEESARQYADKVDSLAERLAALQSEHNALREKLASVTAVADERGRLLERFERANYASDDNAADGSNN